MILSSDSEKKLYASSRACNVTGYETDAQRKTETLFAYFLLTNSSRSFDAARSVKDKVSESF